MIRGAAATSPRGRGGSDMQDFRNSDEHRQELDRLLDEIRTLAPVGHHIALHVRALQPSWLEVTYPRTWTDLYAARSYAIVDPTVAWAMVNDGACRWSDVDLPDVGGVMESARDHGLTFGAVAAAGMGVSRSMCGFARGDRELTDAELGRLARIVARLHKLFEETLPKLTDKQIEILRLIEKGYRQEQAAEMLGIGLQACKLRLIYARRALGARNTTEAVAKARAAGLLT